MIGMLLNIVHHQVHKYNNKEVRQASEPFHSIYMVVHVEQSHTHGLDCFRLGFNYQRTLF